MTFKFETKHIIYAAPAVVLYCLLKPFVVYLLDPLQLRKYPAPSLLAAVSPAWLLKQTWGERRSRSIHKAHDKLGSVIRIGPNQISFNIPEAINDIYGHQAARKLMKDTFYERLSSGESDIVTSRDHEDHAQRRRYLSNLFALKTVVEMEPIIQENFRRMLNHIDNTLLGDSKIDAAVFDIRKWLNFFTLDVIGDMAFGLPMGFVSHGSDTKEAQTQTGKLYNVYSTVASLHQGVRYSVTISQLLSTETMQRVKSIVKAIPLARRITNDIVSDHFEHICINQLRRRLEKGESTRPQGDFFGRILEDRDGKSRNLPFSQLTAESMVFMNAGSETTAAALTNTLYFLIKTPEALEKLRAEVETCISPNDERDIVPYELVRELPYLRACIDESLRLRPPIAYALQRLVTAPEGVTIAGHFVKQGTVVAVPPYSVHRNADLFSDPERYHPDRWLDPSQKGNLTKYNIVFSQGPRQCLGRHIAIVELQILISSLTRRYDMNLLSEDQELLTFDRFNSNPGPLPIIIKRRQILSKA